MDAVKKKKAWIRLIAKVDGILLAGILLWLFIGEIRIVHNRDMEPSLKDGDLCVTYKASSYYPGDIVLYRFEGVWRFGRVAASTGDVVEIREDGYYTVNGIVPYETGTMKTYPAAGRAVGYPYTVKEGEVFVLNDAREEGNDSRLFAGVSDLHGKVVLVIRRRGF
ncbi:MAG: signal peptidase I [Erysipelotrichales bacterium]|nr:signal peptidase I [Erysipelotrichales bacterium]